MLQSLSATTITSVETEENVWIFRIIHTRVHARQALPASTVKLVSIVIRIFHAAYQTDGLKQYV